jgi:hypothetical protein
MSGPSRSFHLGRSRLHFEARDLGLSLARIIHEVPAADDDAPHPAVFARLGVLDVLSSTPARPARPGRVPQYRPLRAPWLRIRGAVTTAMSLHRRGTATKKTEPWRRNPSGRWGSWPISSLLVVDDARASTFSSRLDLGSRAPSAGGTGERGRALGRKPHWARHLVALAT